MMFRCPFSPLAAPFTLLLTLVCSPPANADDESGFAPLFDGRTLTGWQGNENFWRVQDGVVIAESTPDHPCRENTFLVWEHGEVDNFELRLKFRISGSGSANSGVQFRSSVREDGHVIGYQADIDKAGQWVGALYDEATGRQMLAARGQKTVIAADGRRQTTRLADAGELLKHLRQDDWNDYHVRAVGEEITLSINGHTTAHVIDRQSGERELIGNLALQLHSGPPMKIEFRDVRLKRLPMEQLKKVVFVAGSASHGWMSHEHKAGCLLLADKLNTSREEHGVPVVATVYTNGWPKDTTAFDNADTVVSYCDGGGGHYLNDRLQEFDALMKQGVGLVCIHYAVETAKGEPGDHFLRWIGGYFEPHWSVNPHWTANFDELPEHPVTRGVKPFEINDEWYYHMRFVPDLENVTPILTDLPPRETLNRQDGHHSGNPYVREAVLQRKEPQHVAWAYERPGGGRGFGFTGGHFHRNWQHDEFRKIVLNAIVWTAGLNIPDEGVPSTTPTDAEMEANQDEPKPANAQAPRRRQRGQVRRSNLPAAGTARAEYSSPVISADTPGHAVDVEVDIKGARSLYLAVTDGGDGYGCDWAAWAEPLLSTASGNTLKLTDLKWKSATTGHGRVLIGENSEGKPQRIDGKPVAFGIGAHANSLIEFELPPDHQFTTFRARAGLDDGGTDQGCGSTVQFHVFTSAPSASFLARFSSAVSVTDASRERDDAVTQLDVHDELQASLFSAEPQILNPTNIDVDHRGRVWVCEVVNYRAFRNTDMPQREDGDRILILIDTDGDGVADETKAFYQGRDIDSAHGICVLGTPDDKGTRAIVSAKDQVFYLIDDDGDLKADRKDVLFTGIGGVEHDHGIHAAVFGPDGKLYFNFGNEGRQIKDKHGEPIVDSMGNVVDDSINPYQQGMVFRCNLDGSEFETLGWNFRNNWEVCVDSFGTMWQSDNDDDGNRGTRINYVMEYGNYGYRDELTGAGWREPRTGWEEEIPLRHWHLNDPGVVPNLLQTGAGSPTGICVYEGDLLPATFRNQILHCDAGPNVVRCYQIEQDGAGFKAQSIDVLHGARDNWFRPTDVCVAPDGSLLISDWYDPGVGGHRMQDVERGRVFRVTPKGHDGSYTVPPQDYSTPEGAVRALQSPNSATRYVAWMALMEMGEKAKESLLGMWHSEDERMRARALWALSKIDIDDATKVLTGREALQDPRADIRVLAFRVCRQQRHNFDVVDIHDVIDLQDPSPAVRREILLAARELNIDAVTPVWAELAYQHDGKDRWYLEALGIGAAERWDACLEQYLQLVRNDLSTKAARDIVWRSRAEQTPELLARIILDEQTPREELARYFRAFDFQSSAGKQAVLEKLANAEAGKAGRTAFINAEAFARLDRFDIDQRPEMKQALDGVLDASRGTPQFVKLVDQFRVADRYGELLTLAIEQSQSQIGVDAVRTLLAHNQQPLLREVLWGSDAKPAESLIASLEAAADGRSVNLLRELMQDAEEPIELRRAAVRAVGQVLNGARGLLELAQTGAYDKNLEQAIAGTLHTAQWRVIKEPAAELFPLPEGKNAEALPPLDELLARTGNVERGRMVFFSTGTCHTCHVVNGLGREVGPDLTEIGKKLSKQAFHESILYPSAGISHNYETWTVVTDDGRVLDGLLVSETAGQIQLKDAKAIVHTIPTAEIELRKKQEASLMPADLQKVMSAEELVDVVEYLTTLKAKQP
jgi:putative membrane-bound dehydrogenase-like protein